MKILYYDCFAGISGDMHLGAMIDLGVDKNFLQNELKKLGLTGFQLKVSREKRNNISGTRVKVVVKESQVEKKSKGGKKKSHSHRNLKDIKAIINKSDLNENVKHLSKTMFTKIAESEAKIHNEPIDTIHFHEVGALDSIVDIVGAAICIDHLNVGRIICSTVELGSGFVECKHGKLPIPAPATLDLLKEVPVKTGGVACETTTPTGAAILATFVDEFNEKAEFTIIETGYGIGERELEIPNVLRICLGDEIDESYDEKGTKTETVTVLECNIDDMNPEHYDLVMEKLFEWGADDVYINPIIMKKSRPGITLNVLCDTKKEKQIMKTLFAHTTTLGIRRHRVNKCSLYREFTKIYTKLGEVTIKVGYYNGKIIKVKPEYEDCKQIAKKYNIPIQQVYREVSRVMNEKIKE